MTISEQIKVLCVRQKISLAELEDIAEAAGVTFERSFVLDDGDTV